MIILSWCLIRCDRCRLRTHAVIEPFVIASNRQLSIMHPVHKALVATLQEHHGHQPAARNHTHQRRRDCGANPHSAEVRHGDFVQRVRGWRFVDQALPNDLIKRSVRAIFSLPSYTCTTLSPS